MMIVFWWVFWVFIVEGQSKDSWVWYIKDDCYDVNDWWQYILGWSNKLKIKALEVEQWEVEVELVQVEAEYQ